MTMEEQPVSQAPGGIMISHALKGWSMEKWLCWGSMGVAGLLALFFLLDIIFHFPFGGISPVIDVFCILASGLVFYLGFDAYREIH